MHGNPDGPVTTGSISVPVEVQRPLPSTLAYSDATKIGEAASAAFWQAGVTPDGWVNERTGSSGTLKPGTPKAGEANCVPFSTTVTSLGGVHQYSGTVCRGDSAASILKIAEHGSENAS